MTGTNQKTTKSRGGRSRTGVASRSTRSKSQADTTDETTESVLCLKCKRPSTGEDDHMIACERCEGWTCQACLGITDEVYNLMTSSLPSFHHFCSECEAPALDAALTDADIEEKCKLYCSKMEERILSLEVNMSEKATVDSLGARVIKMEEDMSRLAKDISSTNSKFKLVNDEAAEKAKRIKNIVIRGVNESTEYSDADIVKDILGLGATDQKRMRNTCWGKSSIQLTRKTLQIVSSSVTSISRV